MSERRAIIVGASSGIGRALAQSLSAEGWTVGITGRRQGLLEELAAERPDQYRVAVFDATGSGVPQAMNALVEDLGGLELLVISAGWGELNRALDPVIECATVDLNVRAFTVLVDWAYAFFAQQGEGHLAAISSVAALRGGRAAPAYNASKAYQSNYLEGLRQKAKKETLALVVTDIRPGFVKTPMAKGPGRFWEAPVDKAAAQIHRLLKRRVQVGYVTRRWALVAWLMQRLPNFLWERM